jgi:hypothetical protein
VVIIVGWPVSDILRSTERIIIEDLTKPTSFAFNPLILDGFDPAERAEVLVAALRCAHANLSGTTFNWTEQTSSVLRHIAVLMVITKGRLMI